MNYLEFKKRFFKLMGVYEKINLPELKEYLLQSLDVSIDAAYYRDIGLNLDFDDSIQFDIGYEMVAGTELLIDSILSPELKVQFEEILGDDLRVILLNMFKLDLTVDTIVLSPIELLEKLRTFISVTITTTHPKKIEILEN